MKKDSAKNESLLSEYVSNSEILEEIRQVASADLEITSEDEVWLVQCPKSINLLSLKNHKIKLPGKINHENIECISEEYTDCKQISLGLQSKKVRILPLRGNVVIREKPINIKSEDIESTSSRKSVPFPEGLKERHPLLGVDFKEKLNLKADVLTRLKNCSEFRSLRKKQTITEPLDIKDEPCEVEFVSESACKKVKKEKKRKRQRSEKDEDTPKKKKVSFTQGEEISEELIWIKDL